MDALVDAERTAVGLHSVGGMHQQVFAAELVEAAGYCRAHSLDLARNDWAGNPYAAGLGYRHALGLHLDCWYRDLEVGMLDRCWNLALA